MGEKKGKCWLICFKGKAKLLSLIFRAVFLNTYDEIFCKETSNAGLSKDQSCDCKYNLQILKWSEAQLITWIALAENMKDFWALKAGLMSAQSRQFRLSWVENVAYKRSRLANLWIKWSLSRGVQCIHWFTMAWCSVGRQVEILHEKKGVNSCSRWLMGDWKK